MVAVRGDFGSRIWIGTMVAVAFVFLLVALADGTDSVHEGLEGVAAGGTNVGTGHDMVPVFALGNVTRMIANFVCGGTQDEGGISVFC